MPLAAAGVSAGGSLAGGLLGSKGAKNAASQYKAGLAPALTVQQQASANTSNDAWQSQGWANNALNDANTNGQNLIGGGTLQGLAGINTATGAGQADTQAGVNGANAILSGSQAAQIAQLSPYTSSGSTALNSLQQLAGPGGPLTNKFSFNPSDLQNDPGYQFTLQQGQDALQRSAAAQGKLFSGGTLKSLAGYTTGTANQYFNDAFNRAQSTFNTNQQQALSRINSLQGLAGFGLNASTTGANAIGSTSAAQASNTLGGNQFIANLGASGANAAANLGEQGALAQTNLGETTGQGLSGNALWGQQARAVSSTNFANNAANLYTNTADASAAATLGSANAWTNALNTGTQGLLKYLATTTPSGGTPTPTPTTLPSNLGYDGAPGGTA